MFLKKFLCVCETEQYRDRHCRALRVLFDELILRDLIPSVRTRPCFRPWTPGHQTDVAATERPKLRQQDLLGSLLADHDSIVEDTKNQPPLRQENPGGENPVSAGTLGRLDQDQRVRSRLLHPRVIDQIHLTLRFQNHGLVLRRMKKREVVLLKKQAGTGGLQKSTTRPSARGGEQHRLQIVDRATERVTTWHEVRNPPSRAIGRFQVD